MIFWICEETASISPSPSRFSGTSIGIQIWRPLLTRRDDKAEVEERDFQALAGRGVAWVKPARRQTVRLLLG